MISFEFCVSHFNVAPMMTFMKSSPMFDVGRPDEAPYMAAVEVYFGGFFYKNLKPSTMSFAKLADIA